MDDKTYPDATGQLWRVDPQGTHGWLGVEPSDIPSSPGFHDSQDDPPHGTRCGRQTYRRYSRVEVPDVRNSPKTETDLEWARRRDAEEMAQAVTEGKAEPAESCPKCMIARPTHDQLKGAAEMLRIFVGTAKRGGANVEAPLYRQALGLAEALENPQPREPDTLADLTVEELRELTNAVNNLRDFGAKKRTKRWTEIAERFEQAAKEKAK